MNQNIHPREPLSQVIFIHDYLQLVFQDDIFTIYNAAEIQTGEMSIAQGSAGFCDALVALIGQRLESVSTPQTQPLVLQFESGCRFVVPVNGPSGLGPEAWQFGAYHEPVVVQENV